MTLLEDRPTVDEIADVVIDLPVWEDTPTIAEPTVTVKPYTLADALREAHAAGIEQIQGSYIGGENKACALGAAWLMAKRKGVI